VTTTNPLAYITTIDLLCEVFDRLTVDDDGPRLLALSVAELCRRAEDYDIALDREIPRAAGRLLRHRIA
jgi:hypothetical protein